MVDILAKTSWHPKLPLSMPWVTHEMNYAQRVANSLIQLEPKLLQATPAGPN